MTVSLSVLLKIFPRLLIDFSVIDGIRTPRREKWNLSVTFPFLTRRDQDLTGLEVHSGPADEAIKALEDPSAACYRCSGHRQVIYECSDGGLLHT